MSYTQRILVLIAIIAVCAISCQSKKKKENTGIKIGTKKESVSPFDLGKQTFNGKGKCYTCHKIDKKSIGPSVTEIMRIYKEENADIIAFLKQEAAPIVDPETYTVMKTNFSIIKTFTEEELKGIEVYMSDISNGKQK